MSEHNSHPLSSNSESETCSAEVNASEINASESNESEVSTSDYCSCGAEKSQEQDDSPAEITSETSQTDGESPSDESSSDSDTSEQNTEDYRNYANIISQNLMLTQAIDMFNSGNTKAALAILDFCCEANNPSALRIKGLMKMKGSVIPLDMAGGLELVSQAADAGLAMAMHDLGFFYFHGIAVERDVFKAFEYWQKAAELGHPDSMSQLATCYENGWGLPQPDHTAAIAWFKKAALHNSPIGLYRVGAWELSGNNGVRKNIKQGIDKIKRAAEAGLSDAQYVLGYYYYNGTFVSQNYKKALKLLRRAAEQGNDKAAQFLKSLNSESSLEDKLFPQDK